MPNTTNFMLEHIFKPLLEKARDLATEQVVLLIFTPILCYVSKSGFLEWLKSFVDGYLGLIFEFVGRKSLNIPAWLKTTIQQSPSTQGPSPPADQINPPQATMDQPVSEVQIPPEADLTQVQGEMSHQPLQEEPVDTQLVAPNFQQPKFPQGQENTDPPAQSLQQHDTLNASPVTSQPEFQQNQFPQSQMMDPSQSMGQPQTEMNLSSSTGYRTNEEKIPNDDNVQPKKKKRGETLFNLLFKKYVWPNLEKKVGWRMEQGNRERDRNYLPKGVQRGMGFTKRKDYFDSITGVVKALHEDEPWCDEEEVIKIMKKFDSANEFVKNELSKQKYKGMNNDSKYDLLVEKFKLET